jgi:hypothetical protein
MARYRLELSKKKTKWGGFNKFPNAATVFGVQMTRTGNLTTGLTNEDVERLAKATGMEKEALMPPTLDPTSKVGSYWKTFNVRVSANGIDIDTTNPFDEILYLFCKGHHLVADGTENMSAHHECVLVNADKEAIVKNEKFRKVRRAMRELDKMTTDEMRRALRVLGIYTQGMSNDLVEARIHDTIDKNVDKFITMWINNKNRDQADILASATELNIIRKNRNNYYYGTDLIGTSLDETIAWFKVPGNQEIVQAIKSEIENKSKI